MGLAVAAVAWTWLVQPYVAAIAPLSQRVVHIDPRLRHLDLKVQDDDLILRGGGEGSDLPLGWLAAGQLTHNVILLAGLFAMTRGLLRGRTVVTIIAAFLVLMITHVLAVAAGIEQVYATTAGAWSDAHYGGTEQDFWKAAYFAYQLAGMYAIAFALWWVSGSSEVRTGRARSAA